MKVMLGMAASWLFAAWRCSQPFAVSSTLEFRAAVWGWQRGRTVAEDQGIELALQVEGAQLVLSVAVLRGWLRTGV